MTPGPQRVIVLGVGNPLMQDDGVGVWALSELAARYELPSVVRLVDGGVSGFAWLDELADAELLLIVDAVRGSESPGTLCWLTPEELADRLGPVLSAHDVTLADVLAMARLLNQLPPTRILGVQTTEGQQVGLELTPVLRRALPSVAAALADELHRLGLAASRKAPPSEAEVQPSPGEQKP
ncbi:MAG TPA: hydrogenase maturation protease [Pirellulales bacterium]|nr:hydrogenase maturation protease [Pirellulales bacterium]